MEHALISALSQVYYQNAINILRDERQIRKKFNHVYARLHTGLRVEGGVASFLLSNPFIQTALKILETFESSYKVQQAIRLLRAAGEEAEKEKRKE